MITKQQVRQNKYEDQVVISWMILGTVAGGVVGIFTPTWGTFAAAVAIGLVVGVAIALTLIARLERRKPKMKQSQFPTSGFKVVDK